MAVSVPVLRRRRCVGDIGEGERVSLERSGAVIITGGSSGIGRGTAAHFARLGWRVGLVARGRAGLEDTLSELNGAGAIAVADVADPAALEAAAARLELTLGPIDVWINCAGNGTYGRFLDTPEEEFRRVTDVTYLGTVNGTRCALRRMLPVGHGHIVNVCSAVAFHGMPLLSSYSGAKSAIAGFDQAVRAELAQERSRVRLTTVFPPAVNTPFFDHAPSHMGRPGRPMPPVYQPEIVAEAIYYAAVTARAAVLVSFTTVLFSWGMRLVPGLVDVAIRRLGYGGQLSALDASRARYRPTLFAPSCEAAPIHGGYGAEARGWSLQVLLQRGLFRLRGKRKQSFFEKKDQKTFIH